MDSRSANVDFTYTYSAKEQDEIIKIRQKYEKQEEGGIERLRKLDAKVSARATVISLALGIIGALVLGSGMSMIMTDLETILGINTVSSMIVGIILGVIGLVVAAMAYPVYTKILRIDREKLAPEILKLTEELMK